MTQMMTQKLTPNCKSEEGTKLTQKIMQAPEKDYNDANDDVET
jgi:hypothetical protein